MKGIKFLLLLLTFSVCAAAQTDSLLLNSSSAKTLKKIGKNALLQDDPNSAITFLEAYLKTSYKDAEAQALLGKAYMRTRDYEQARRAFMRAYQIDKEKIPEALYFHALMQKSCNNYDTAKVVFQRFQKEYKGDDKALKKQALREISFCDSIKSLFGLEPSIVIKHLDTGINKVHIEAAPASLSQNELIYTSFRTETKEYVQEDDTTLEKHRKLYLAKREKGAWVFKGEFGENFNDERFHTGNAALSPDRKRVYFTRCRMNSLDKMVCTIYLSTLVDGKWSEPEKLPAPVNYKKYTSTMPSVGADPVKGNDILYFVSDRPGGKGKLDIWYSSYNKKNKVFQAPKNAGAKVNTAENEISPFFDSETRSLYYSSDGSGGLGGYDIFKTLGDGKQWTGHQNLGLPLNSGADDIFYTIATDRQEGFFVSNRKGGNALKNRTCCDDIYYYKLLKYVLVTLSGNVSEMMDPSSPLANAVVEIFFIDKVTKEKVLVKRVSTDAGGNYSTSVEPGHDYFVVVKKDDYLGTSGEFTTQDVLANKNINVDLQLVRKPKLPIHIPNVRYQYDRSELEEGSKLPLDTTVFKLMVDNPEIIVEIMAHTDSKGTDAYNLKLSQKRAESVVKYLLSKGIAPGRLKARGYGETMPVAPNSNPDGTDNPLGRAKNRRTDFKIIGVIDAEIIIDSEVPD